MSNKNLIVNTPEPKPGILERGDLFAIAVGMVIGSGMVTLIGPAMAMTGYSVWLAYLTAIVMGCVPCLLFIYVGLAMVTGGVLPHDEVAGAPTILPAAQAILPGAVYKIFMIGGPIMAIITTLNGVFNDVRYPLAQAAKDGWLPKFILKENRFGAPYLIYTYTLIVVLIPIVTDMSIVTITNIFQVITFFMNVTVVYAISRLPKRYPEAWAKNKFHFSNGALYTFCTVSIIIYTVIFVKGIFSIKVSYAVAAVIVMLALILIGIYLTKKGGIRIETSLWDPSVKKEEK